MIVPHATRLRALREARGLSRKDVAAASGVSERAIRIYESGEADDFSGARLSLLADFYGVGLTDVTHTEAERAQEQLLAQEVAASKATRVLRIAGNPEVVNWFADLATEERNRLVSQMHHQHVAPAKASA